MRKEIINMRLEDTLSMIPKLFDFVRSWSAKFTV